MMNKKNMNENGFETSIVDYLVQINEYEEGSNNTYDKKYAVDIERLFRFLESTQKQTYDLLKLFDEQKRIEFIKRLSNEIHKRGINDVLKNGINYYPANNVVMFYLTPNEKNPTAVKNFNMNIFSVTRQLNYSEINENLALDLCVFINGLPVITMELKNRVTGQNYMHAVEQYKNDRDCKEVLFSFKRCIAHFAVDENEIMFTTKISGESTYFMPFNKGNNGGAGNPPNNGTMTDYLWKDLLNKRELTNIIENFVQVVKEKGNREKQIFPRYHQWNVVRKILKDVKENGIGKKYLIQHSAGSGKSNSITWLAYQLSSLEKDGKILFDSIIVVTDRKNLDTQLNNNLKAFLQVNSNLGHANNTSKLKDLLVSGKRIIISTVQKFPYLLDIIGKDLQNKNYGIIIDEAHSSQSGRASASMNMALSGGVDEEKDIEDLINDIVKKRKMLKNASYFAFTATPKSKTLEMFGMENPDVPEQKIPFDNYSMKQAIEEGFILDVLKHYTTIDSYYKIKKTIDDNPQFDKQKSSKKIRKFVEDHKDVIEEKAQIMLDHFHSCTAHKLKGKARAMIVTASIERAIKYYYTILKLLEERNSPYKPIIAFSGSKTYEGKEVTESDINGFSDRETPEKFKEDPYRFLIVADKYQTGYDEPLLHTMYVDKILNDVKAVQTLSRLNRCMFGKVDTCVLDFANKSEEIMKSFSRFYKQTILEGETDPNKLYDILSEIENCQVYTDTLVDECVRVFLESGDRALIDSMLDSCVENYKNLDEENQVIFKSGAKAFVRTYNFLASILPISQPQWEKISIFLTLLIPKLPAPKEEDLSKGILESIDLESYRAHKNEEMSISLSDEHSTINPMGASIGNKQEVQIEFLDVIVNNLNDIWGNIQWNDKESVAKQINNLPDAIMKNESFRNTMKNSDKQNSRIEFERVLEDIMQDMIKDNLELFKQFSSNKLFKKYLEDMIFERVYNSKFEN